MFVFNSGRPLSKTVGEGYLFGEFTLFGESYTSAAVIAEKGLVVQVNKDLILPL